MSDGRCRNWHMTRLPWARKPVGHAPPDNAPAKKTSPRGGANRRPAGSIELIYVDAPPDAFDLISRRYRVTDRHSAPSPTGPRY